VNGFPGMVLHNNGSWILELDFIRVPNGFQVNGSYSFSLGLLDIELA